MNAESSNQKPTALGGTTQSGEQSPYRVAETPPSDQHTARRWVMVDFTNLAGVPCPCGTARRAFADTDLFPGTIHVTEIAVDAKTHYHKKLTETYFFLECGPDARMQLDQEILPVRPGVCIVIPPGVRHRAIGRMKVLIIVVPKFDPDDEWFD